METKKMKQNSPILIPITRKSTKNFSYSDVKSPTLSGRSPTLRFSTIGNGFDECKSPFQRTSSKKLTGFGFLFQDQRFSVLRERKESTNINNEILSTLKRMDLESLTDSQLLEFSILVLQKPPEFRATVEINLLMKCCENVEFFQKYDYETREQICKFMGYESLNKGKTLFEIGSSGSTFYIILKGSVGVWVNIPKQIEDEKKEIKTILTLTEVKVLNTGASFGELALIDKKPRAATIICREDCQFGVLDKVSFERILKKKEQKKLYENIEFLASFKIFSEWSFNSVKSLYYQTEKMKFQRKQFVYNEGDTPKGLFFIRTGEFRITKKIKINTWENKIIEDRYEDDNEIDRFFINVPKKKNYYYVKHFEEGILSSGNFFGEEELLEDCPRKYSIQCLSNDAELFFLNKKDFHRKIVVEENSLNYLKEFISQKKRLSEQRLNQFVYAEKSYILPKKRVSNYTYLNISPPSIEDKTVKESTKLFDKSYEKMYKLLQTSISSRQLNEDNIMISRFESEEKRKLSMQRKYAEIKKKNPLNIKNVSLQESFLSKLMNFENNTSVAKMLNRRLIKMRKKNKQQDFLDKNKSL